MYHKNPKLIGFQDFFEMLLWNSDEGAGITGNYLPSLAVNSNDENNMEFFGHKFTIDK